MAATTMTSERVRRYLLVAALVGFGLLVYSTIHPFVGALTWGVILVLALWPVYRGLRKGLPGPRWLAPLLMVILITVIFVLPLGLVGILAVGEAQTLVEDVRAAVMGEKGDLAGSLREIPLVGKDLSEKLLALRDNPDDFQRILNDNKQTLLGIATRAMGDLVDNLFQLVVCVFSAFFLFLHGEMLAEQLRRALGRVGGPRMAGLLGEVRATVRAVVYGIVMTALAQGALAAVGFYLAGVGFPLLLALLTFVFSFIPFGPPFIWVPAALSLLLDGHVGWGIFLAAWGAGVISTVDNVLRPIFIGRATQMPVLIVFIGVLGGVMSFGMVGLFVGPVVMGVALTLWREWTSRREDGNEAGSPPAAPAGATVPAADDAAPGGTPAPPPTAAAG